MSQPAPLHARAILPLPDELPRRYMLQLCKHFEHRRPVTYSDNDGSISFDAGHCALHADITSLTLNLTAPDTDALTRLEDVVARHLLRFAFRDPPEIVWKLLD